MKKKTTKNNLFTRDLINNLQKKGKGFASYDRRLCINIGISDSSQFYFFMWMKKQAKTKTQEAENMILNPKRKLQK